MADDPSRIPSGINPQLSTRAADRPPVGLHQINVNQAIAGQAGAGSVVSVSSLSELLALKIEANPSGERIEPNLPLQETILQNGVQLTTGEYLLRLGDPNSEIHAGLIRKAQDRMDGIRTRQTISIESENFQAGGTGPRMDYGFARACSKAAEQGAVFIMRGVNPFSLGEGGVLADPDRYAPKPMTCHSKSSEFGFTKGLVPVNPQFSRPAYVDTSGSKYQGAFRDVNETLGRNKNCRAIITAGTGSAEGKALHLKRRINDEECHVYQGTFNGTDGKIYRYQVAIPDKDRFCFHAATTQKLAEYVQQALKDENKAQYLCLYQDGPSGSQWTPLPKLDSHTKSHAKNGDLMAPSGFTAEPTLVIGLPAGTEGSQHAAKERYYVADYDVYAIAHTDPTDPSQASGVMQALQRDWPNCGAFADNQDIRAINFVNALLLSSLKGASTSGEIQRALDEYRENYDSNHRDRPIQHATAAAGTVKTTTTGLEGFAVPDFPLWAVEGG
ncbi:MAG: hypothetical protein LBT57_00025, partial [Puniceicoccales bacterium]|nr:hypothetical protein [Puniceicoccales bacterium]